MNSVNTSNIKKTNEIKSKIELANIKNDDTLKKIFENMKKNKSLGVIKYNKKLQKRLNLSLNDYKDFYQNYSSIEIELTPAEDIYGKFINILDADKQYYHIYFDNSKEEIKRTYLNKNEKINAIKIIIDYQIKSFNKLFDNCKCINSINIKNLKEII